ncbi:MAG: carbohydrate ABC transporter permease [Lachnospiraceae bacterium]|nr:carbohydrate ABC transporter permease [Lachnospiraceae bacterium]
MNKKKKMSGAEVLFQVIACLIFGLLALICLYPFYYLFICTISDNELVALGKVIFYPKGIHIDNYRKVLGVENLGNATLISILKVVVGTVSRLLVTSYMAYFFTKQEMPGRKIFYRYVIATMYFGAGLIPNYLNLRALGLLNSFWVYIIPGILGVYNMVLVKTSMESLPAELEESAFLDGAGYLTRLYRIVLPLQKPILATIGLFSIVGLWNDYVTTKLYITKPKLYTLQFLLYELLNRVSVLAAQEEHGRDEALQVTPFGIQMTLTAVVTIPIMCVYPFIQRYYVKGVMIGAVKG